MNTHSTIFISLFVGGAFLSSCSTRDDQKQTDLVTFPLRGEVVAVDSAKLRVTISHKEIPDYMMAMTMPFKVKDAKLLATLESGDSVVGTLAVSRTESWLAALSVLSKGEPPSTLTAGDIQMKRLFKPGDPLPNLPFVNQDGNRVSFSTFRGKVLAFTFVYTRCPLPDFCIRMSSHFARIQKLLKDDPSLNDRWHLMTISFDPKFDTPKVLKEYGRSYGADFSTWDFLTDPETSGRNVIRLADGLDLTYEDDEGGLISHNLRTVLVDQEGRLVEVINDNEWKPEEVVEKMRTIVNSELSIVNGQ